MNRKPSVLIVDDSGTMRRLIRFALEKDGRFEIVGEARDAAQASSLLRTIRPDVMTLDVEMPGQSGIEFLAEVMAARPLPVVMVSTLTQQGSAAAVEALSIGAVECFGKPVNALSTGAFEGLGDVILGASTAKVRSRPAAPIAAAPVKSERFDWNRKLILIGSSTGGVEALERVLKTFPENGPPVLVTQHMPESFLSSFAQRLNQAVKPQVQLAEENMPIEQGHIYIAPGGASHLVLKPGLRLMCGVAEGPKRSAHRPSVDVLMESAVPLGRGAIGVILTGMGRDGAEGVRCLRQAGGSTLAQDKATSIVWGMPGVAYEEGGIDELLPIDEIGPKLLEMTKRGAPRPRKKFR